uniref:Antitoxin n=3 Tax=Rhodococcus hoagii TaxID=43767 RepID=A0A1Z1UW50_RHOHA|nr:putative Phd/YeFM family antitoxin [Prescottella equi]
MTRMTRVWSGAGAGPPADTMTCMRTVPIDEAQSELPRLVDQAARGRESYEITRDGDRVAVIDDYDALRETIVVLADQWIYAEHLVGQADIAAGDVLDVTGLTALLAEERPHRS